MQLVKDNSEADLVTSLSGSGVNRKLAEKKLYEQFFYLIKMGGRKYKLDEETCITAYSDTIISVINNVTQGQFEGRSSLKSYVHQIFMNKCVDAIRKKTTKKNTFNDNAATIDSLIHVLPDRARTAVQQMIDSSDQTLLYGMVKELGEKCKQLLMLFEDGYDDKEIALQMQYNSADVVKTTRLRCLEKLRERYFTNGRL